MKNTLLVLLSLIMIVFSTSAFAEITGKVSGDGYIVVGGMPVERGSLYYEPFTPNLANGTYLYIDDNGKKKERKTYKDGKQEGLTEYYYENGQLRVRWTYKDGKWDGLYESYKSDGTLIEKCFYVNGKKYECE